MYFVGRTCPREPVLAAASVRPVSIDPPSSPVMSSRNFDGHPMAAPIAHYFTMLPFQLFSH